LRDIEPALGFHNPQSVIKARVVLKKEVRQRGKAKFKARWVTILRKGELGGMPNTDEGRRLWGHNQCINGTGFPLALQTGPLCQRYALGSHEI